MKFRKKPVIIDAQPYEPGMEDGFLTPKGHFWPSEKKEEMYEWVGDPRTTKYRPVIKTLEGYYEIGERDWIITSVKGERC
jgi:hypothetical protein